MASTKQGFLVSPQWAAGTLQTEEHKAGPLTGRPARFPEGRAGAQGSREKEGAPPHLPAHKWGLKDMICKPIN